MYNSSCIAILGFVYMERIPGRDITIGNVVIPTLDFYIPEEKPKNGDLVGEIIKEKGNFAGICVLGFAHLNGLRPLESVVSLKKGVFDEDIVGSTFYPFELHILKETYISWRSKMRAFFEEEGMGKMREIIRNFHIFYPEEIGEWRVLGRDILVDLPPFIFRDFLKSGDMGNGSVNKVHKARESDFTLYQRVRNSEIWLRIFEKVKGEEVEGLSSNRLNDIKRGMEELNSLLEGKKNGKEIKKKLSSIERDIRAILKSFKKSRRERREEPNEIKEKLRDAVASAYREVFFEESVKIIDGTEPQKPFLFSQLLNNLSFDEINAAMIKELRDKSTFMGIFFSSICKFVGRGGDCYEWDFLRLRESFANKIRSKKEEGTMRALRDEFNSIFSKELENRGITGSINWNDVDEFMEYVVEELFGGEIDNELKEKISSSDVKSEDSALGLMAAFLGFDPSKLNEMRQDEERDLNLKNFNLGKDDKEKRWQFMKKLILGPLLLQVNMLDSKLAGETIDPTGIIFGDLIKGDEIDFGCCKAVVKMRTKGKYSILRKLLERSGELVDKDGNISIAKFVENVKDFNGCSIVLTSKKEGLSDAEAVGEIAQRTVGEIINVVIRRELSSKQNIRRVRISKVRDNIDGLDLKKLFGSGSVNIELDIKESDLLSSASRISWKWLKFVIEIELDDGRRVMAEYQMFPSNEEWETKKEDDDKYRSKRAITPARGRFSVMYLLFGPEALFSRLHKQWIKSKKRYF